MTDEQDELDELTDARVRALLRHAGEPAVVTPPDVVARIDAALSAEAARRVTAERTPAPEGEGQRDEVLSARLARERRRSRWRLLGAAAAVVVIATGAGSVLQQGGVGMSSGDAGGGGSAAESSTAGRITGGGQPPPRLHRATFGRDAVHALGLGDRRDTAVLSEGALTAGNTRGTAKNGPTQDLPRGERASPRPTREPRAGSGGAGANSTSDGVVADGCARLLRVRAQQAVPVRLDGRRAVLVAVPLSRHRTLAAAFPCGSTTGERAGTPGTDLSGVRRVLPPSIRRLGEPVATAVIATRPAHHR